LAVSARPRVRDPQRMGNEPASACLWFSVGSGRAHRGRRLESGRPREVTSSGL